MKFDENGKKVIQMEENTLGKGEIAQYEQFLLALPQRFQKTCTADTCYCEPAENFCSEKELIHIEVQDQD